MRATWSGILRLGLINIPVKLYNASRERPVAFRLIDRHDHCPITYTKVCRSDGHIVPAKDVVKGYEYEPGKYVVITPHDLKRANARKTSSLEIIHFAQEQDINPKWYHRPWYVVPEERSVKAYALLRQALDNAHRIAIVRFVLRERERIGVLRFDPESNSLVVLELSYQDELIHSKQLPIPGAVRISNTEVAVAVSLVNALTRPFTFTQYKDTHFRELRRIIKQKIEGVRPAALPEEEAPEATHISQILNLLQKSLEQARLAARLEKHESTSSSHSRRARHNISTR